MTAGKLCPSPNLSNSSLIDTANNNYECNIILCDENVCLDAVESERRANEDAWNSHIQRIEILARPKKSHNAALCECCCGNQAATKGKKMSLEELLPRIKVLSQPKRITPKYVKPPEIKCRTKSIKDWEAHEKWLEKRAKPKEFFPFNYCTTCPNPKQLDRDGWRRLTDLAQPKVRKMPSRLVKFRKVCYAPTTARIYQLCKPKVRSLPQCCAGDVSVSASAMSYQASERINQLAIPKRYNMSELRGEGCHIYECSDSNLCSTSFDNLYFKDCNMRVK